ncbi:MAG TPA: HAMP domain-containing sensor histidine kinase [Planctomycetota bacterium]|nr:HAMP domain-containing sensor histidine kinase [Planctomycetota bacterium]
MSPIEAGHLPGLLGHELRNPLAAAMTRVTLAREMVDAGDPRVPVLDGALRDLERMTSILDGWLAIARTGYPQQGAIGVAELLSAVASRHGAEVVCCAAEASVQGNRALLERALDNLCENALQAGAQTIRIAAQSDQAEVDIHVEDDGSGVVRDCAEKIFEAGWSTNGSAGLGLYAVATTVKVLSGRIRCVPLTRGTRFTITLPRAAARPARA